MIHYFFSIFDNLFKLIKASLTLAPVWKSVTCMFKSLNNCDELIKFVIEELNDFTYNNVEFQGDNIEVTTTTLDYIDIGVIKGRCLIIISQSLDGAFDLYCIHGIVHFNKQYPCVVVPDYVKEELIDTLASYKV